MGDRYFYKIKMRGEKNKTRTLKGNYTYNQDEVKSVLQK